MVENIDAESIRQRVHERDVAGLQFLAADVVHTSEQLLDGRLSADRIIRDVHVLIERILAEAKQDVDVGRARLKAMLRYLLENGQYKPDSSQLSFLLEHGILRPEDRLIDLGAGPAGLLGAWVSDHGMKGIGTDLSPSFISKNPQLLRLGLIDDETEYLATLLGLEYGQNNDLGLRQPLLVHTGLTLDRVARPKQLICNMREIANGGRIAINSLFPVIAVDDEKVERPIEYTPPRHRIANTGTVDGDLRQVQEFVSDITRSTIRIIPGHYDVITNSGAQEYDKNRFFYLTNA